jgi:glutathione S-transferase
MADITLHGTKLSGHAHRVELLLRMLGLDYTFADAPRPSRASPEFLALNPLAQIPVLQDGDLVLADSNAILVYLAKRYDSGRTWLPEDPADAAIVQRWLSIAAGEVAFGPALARSIAVWDFPAGADKTRAKAVTERLFGFMQDHLADRRFLAADHPTIADLACYSYIAAAPEGGIPLTPYPTIEAWLRRVEALPHFAPMPKAPVPEPEHA